MRGILKGGTHMSVQQTWMGIIQNSFDEEQYANSWASFLESKNERRYKIGLMLATILDCDVSPDNVDEMRAKFFINWRDNFDAFNPFVTTPDGLHCIRFESLINFIFDDYFNVTHTSEGDVNQEAEDDWDSFIESHALLYCNSWEPFTVDELVNSYGKTTSATRVYSSLLRAIGASALESGAISPSDVNTILTRESSYGARELFDDFASIESICINSHMSKAERLKEITKRLSATAAHCLIDTSEPEGFRFEIPDTSDVNGYPGITQLIADVEAGVSNITKVANGVFNSVKNFFTQTVIPAAKKVVNVIDQTLENSAFDNRQANNSLMDCPVFSGSINLASFPMSQWNNLFTGLKSFTTPSMVNCEGFGANNPNELITRVIKTIPSDGALEFSTKFGDIHVWRDNGSEYDWLNSSEKVRPSSIPFSMTWHPGWAHSWTVASEGAVYPDEQSSISEVGDNIVECSTDNLSGTSFWLRYSPDELQASYRHFRDSLYSNTNYSAWHDDLEISFILEGSRKTSYSNLIIATQRDNNHTLVTLNLTKAVNRGVGNFKFKYRSSTKDFVITDGNDKVLNDCQVMLNKLIDSNTLIRTILQGSPIYAKFTCKGLSLGGFTTRGGVYDIRYGDSTEPCSIVSDYSDSAFQVQSRPLPPIHYCVRLASVRLTPTLSKVGISDEYSDSYCELFRRTAGDVFQNQSEWCYGDKYAKLRNKIDHQCISGFNTLDWPNAGSPSAGIDLSIDDMNLTPIQRADGSYGLTTGGGTASLFDPDPLTDGVVNGDTALFPFTAILCGGISGIDSNDDEEVFAGLINGQTALFSFMMSLVYKDMYVSNGFAEGDVIDVSTGYMNMTHDEQRAYDQYRNFLSRMWVDMAGAGVVPSTDQILNVDVKNAFVARDLNPNFNSLSEFGVFPIQLFIIQLLYEVYKSSSDGVKRSSLSDAALDYCFIPYSVVTSVPTAKYSLTSDTSNAGRAAAALAAAAITAVAAFMGVSKVVSFAASRILKKNSVVSAANATQLAAKAAKNRRSLTYKIDKIKQVAKSEKRKLTSDERDAIKQAKDRMKKEANEAWKAAKKSNRINKWIAKLGLGAGLAGASAPLTAGDLKQAASSIESRFYDDDLTNAGLIADMSELGEVRLCSEDLSVLTQPVTIRSEDMTELVSSSDLSPITGAISNLVPTLSRVIESSAVKSTDGPQGY